MAVEHTPKYMTAMGRFYANHPDELSQIHRAHLGGLGLSEEAQSEMVKRNAPELAHHPDIEAIGGMPKSEHAKAVAALHEKELAGPETENSETNEYIRNRKDAILSGERKAGRREYRAALRR